MNSKLHTTLISSKNKPEKPTKKGRFFFFLVCFYLGCSSLFAQTGSVSGNVADSSANEPLVGANVYIRSLQKSAIVDTAGNFSLTNLPDGTYLVETSFVGYKTKSQQVTVANGEAVKINISVAGDSRMLDNVVIIGYGTAKKEDLTGSVAVIESKDFNKGVISSPDQLIVGKTAGVVVTSNGGAAGAGSTIRIRGGTSLSASNDPLIVIDGVPMSNVTIGGAPSPLSLINPNDIETFTILKDASATAIYGNRASNGVIIITTKRGTAGRLTVNFSTTQSIQKKVKDVDVLTGDQVRSYVNANGTTAQKALLGSENTNWQDQIYRTAYSTDNNLSFSGGIKNLPYRVSIGYLDQNGILKTNYMRRTSVGLNLSPSFFKNTLAVTLNVKATQSDNRFANFDAISDAVRADPTKPVTNGSPFDGYYEWVTPNGSPNLLANGNPVADLMQKKDVSTVKRSIGNLMLSYKIPGINGLSANVNLGYDVSKSEGSVTISENNARAYLKGGQYNSYQQYNRNLLGDGYLSYKKDLKRINSKFDVTAGTSYQDFYRAVPSSTITSIVGTYPSTASYPDSSQNTLLSFYGRINYTFMDRYLLTASIRRDGSSRFSKDNRWGSFPAIALAWKINQEAFLRSSRVVSELKLRAGFGVTGNQDIGYNYGYFPNYLIGTSQVQYPFGGSTSPTYRSEAYNEALKWETTKTYNAAIDYGFFNNRIYGSIDVYIKNTTDLLNDVTVAAGSNLSNHVIANVGSMESKGIEFNINATAISKKDFTWQFGFNLTHNQNKITKLTTIEDPTSPGVLTGVIGGATGNSIQIFAVGQTPYSFYAYNQVYNADGTPVEGVYTKSGSTLFNLNKSPNPKLTLGFNTRFTYKKWDLSTSLHGSIGNYVYNNVKSSNGASNSMLNSLGYIGNAHEDVLYSNFKTSQYLSNYYLENASFLRMDNLTLSYDFGKVFKKKIGIRLSAIVQNVFVITKYSGVDPEVFSGIDNNLYPRARTYSLGANFQF